MPPAKRVVMTYTKFALHGRNCKTIMGSDGFSKFMGGKKMIFKHMDRIVFAGDSVTDMESAQPVGEGLFENVGKSYVRIVENMLSAFYPEVYILSLIHI